MTESLLYLRKPQKLRIRRKMDYIIIIYSFNFNHLNPKISSEYFSDRGIDKHKLVIMQYMMLLYTISNLQFMSSKSLQPFF